MIKRILKIFLILVGLACIGCICIIILFPHSVSDLEKRHLDEMSYYEDEVIVTSRYNEVQYDNDYLYYINYIDSENHDLLRRKDGKDSLVSENVTGFLIKENEIYYLNENGLYCKQKDGTDRRILPEEVFAFAMGGDVNLIHTGKYIYTYDKDWKKINTCNLKKVCGHTLYGEFLYSNGYMILTDTEYNSVFAYSIEKNAITPIYIPINAEKGAVFMDMIKKGKQIYCMLGLYEDSDLYSFRERIDYPDNGVYELDTNNMQLKKISDTCGFSLLCLKEQLYVVDGGYLIHYLKEVR